MVVMRDEPPRPVQRMRECIGLTWGSNYRQRPKYEFSDRAREPEHPS